MRHIVSFFTFLTIAFISFHSTADIQVSDCELSGLWKHLDKEAVLNIDTTSGEVTVHSHKTNPSAEGLVIIKGLQARNNEPEHWLGNIYDAASNSFVPVTLNVSSCQHIEVFKKGKRILTLNKKSS
ncbi:hypothetical protein ACFSJY_15275 [Thalassotalea euphylliae]|uniref:hypothetical protein n=1 Tax=Thalassotalea euphylliae TaxID=1655234 RepID=UPI0036393C67